MSNIILKSNIVNKISRELKSLIEGLTKEDGINTINIIFITAQLMEHLSTYKEFKGREKKQIVIKILVNFIEDSDMEDINKMILNEVVKNLVPNAIDTIIDVSKGRYKFEIKDVKKIFPCCN